MAQNINTYIAPQFTLAAGATANCDVRLSDIADMKIMTVQICASTSSVTGVAINLYPGFGGVDPAEVVGAPIPHVLSNPASANVSTVPVFANNYASVLTPAGNSAISQPTSNSSTLQTTRTIFYLNSMLVIWPQWVRIQIINLDSTYPNLISLPAEI